MNDDNKERTLEEHLRLNACPSGYKPEWTQKQYNPTKDEKVIIKAFRSIKSSHPWWTEERCLEQALSWFNKKKNEGLIK
jgi:hypothetical protein